ncbi:unnamed protein product, partial [Adineta ricciae]
MKISFWGPLQNQQFSQGYSESASTSVTSDDTFDNTLSTTISNPYDIRTLNENNMTHKIILPVFPPDGLRSSTTDTSSKSVHLLLTNVWLEQFSDEQFEQAYKTCMKHSYMWNFYQKLYVDTKKRFRVDISLIDYNLQRLHECLTTVTTQRNLYQKCLTWDEMILALEFYLQIDVDTLCLKTFSFNNVQPRVYDHQREGLFSLALPEARFAIRPCNSRYCHSPCQRRYTADEPEPYQVVPFSISHIHQFVNGYEAILNCPA